MTHLEFTCSDKKATAILRAARLYDEQAEGTGHASYSQVSQALCGKENATLDEILREVSQVKSRLAQAERERDAALKDITNKCKTCKHSKKMADEYPCSRCCYQLGLPEWEWRGVCPENTKEEAR